MKIIRHRRNTLEELNETPHEYGVEVDIRSLGHDLLIQHDPFKPGERFDDWIAAYRHGILVLNVKEEGLEGRLLDLMARHGISDFFFLDQSFPFLIKTAKTGERRCAVRVSEFESIETALSLSGKVGWVWIDYFTRYPLSREQTDVLRQAGFKLCMVSPELQGYGESELVALKNLFESEGMVIDAVCTKKPELWV